MCFKKNVFNSESCQNTTNWLSAKNRMYVLVGSNHRTGLHWTGVNCNIALFILPVVDEISLKQIYKGNHIRSKVGLNILWIYEVNENVWNFISCIYSKPQKDVSLMDLIYYKEIHVKKWLRTAKENTDHTLNFKSQVVSFVCSWL